MLKTLAEWVTRKLVVLSIQERLRNTDRIVRVGADSAQLTRILISAGECHDVTGTEAQIADAASRLASRTKSCVTVAIVVAYHHRRDCADRRTSGIDSVGN
jgi:hypothetical protein